MRVTVPKKYSRGDEGLRPVLVSISISIFMMEIAELQAFDWSDGTCAFELALAAAATATATAPMGMTMDWYSREQHEVAEEEGFSGAGVRSEVSEGAERLWVFLWVFSRT